MFWIKRCLLLCLSPLTLSLGAIAVGFVCLLTKRHLWLGRVLTVAGLALLVWAGYGHFGRRYLARLEGQYMPLDPAALPAATVTQLKFIVVLGSGQISDPRLPVTSQIGCDSLFRVVEGIRLHRHLPGSRLIFTGGPGFDTTPNAEVMLAVAMELGVPRDEMVALSRPCDTHEEAQSVRELIGAAPFALVTSAAHMPRALRVFEAEGLHPLPAPTDFLFRASPRQEPAAFFPTSAGLACTERALYEILGSLYEAPRNWWHAHHR